MFFRGLAAEQVQLPRPFKRATAAWESFLGAQFDFLVDIGGTLVRAALPSHVCVDQGLLFADGDPCRVNLAEVTWFEGEIVVEGKVNK